MRVALLNSLRTSLRARRRAVPPSVRARAGIRLASLADRSLQLRTGYRVALFASLPEEIDTTPLIALAHRRGCIVYLPRIVDYRAHRMRFARVDPVHVRGHAATRSRMNRYGILEPHAGAETIDPRWLDIAFLPLVAFDERGTRLGMGGGFYDRAFAFRRHRHVWRGPLLVGVGYAFQQVPALNPAPHDVRLDAVLTEERWIPCSTG